MNFLFDDSSPAANPADTDAVKFGAQRIRELKDRLQVVLSGILNNDLTFKGAAIPAGTIAAGSFVAQAVHAADIQNSVFSDGLLKAANADPVKVNVDNVTIGFDSSSPKKIRVIGGTGIVASARNLVAQNNSGTPNSKVDIAADEVILKNSSGASYLARPVSLTIDIGLGVALNGLETGGTESASHWYYLWLISDGTNVRGVLEDAGAGAGVAPAGPDLSGGAFTGYTYTALVGVVRNNASSNFSVFYQTNRNVWTVDTAVFNNLAGSTSYAALSGTPLATFQGLVPPNARTASGNFGCTGGPDTGISLSGTSTAIGTVTLNGGNITGSPFESFKMSIGYSVPLVTAQLLYFKTTDTTSVYRLTCSGFTF